MKKFWIQVVALTTWSFLFLVPILMRGTNIVTNTFTEGSLRFWLGTSPYEPSKVADVFHYSPLFAFLYWPLTLLPGPAHSLIWGFLNVFVFWMGISVWFSFNKKTAKTMWLALAFCAIELDISQRYQQINAMLVGAVLLSLYFYKNNKFVISALLLSLFTNLKLLPVVFLLPLIWPVKKKFLISIAAFSLLWFLLPATYLGFEKNFQFHQLQIEAILGDTAGGHGGRSMLDFASTLVRLGFGQTVLILKWATIALFGMAVLFSRLFSQRVSLGMFYSLVMLGLLVLSPRTESPTFVFLAPAYLFVMEELHGVWKGLIGILGFYISFVFTSVWAPYFKWTYHQNYYCKVIGTFIFLCLVLIMTYSSVLTLRHKPAQEAVLV